MTTNKSISAARAASSWSVPFATDFSGMDMTSFAMDDLLMGDLQPVQLWASDIWSHAQAFCRANHRPEHFYQDVKAKPLPGPPLMF